MVPTGMKKADPVVMTIIDNLFTTMVARSPRRPSQVTQQRNVPDGERVTLLFARLRKRWRRAEPIPRDTQAFAQILRENGVYVFDVQPGHIECQAAQTKIAKALGS